jgi:hypothetical protein
MIQEITQAHYPGVLCSHCNEPIPVQKKAAELYEELKRGVASKGQEINPGAFTLRCRVCDEESVYGIEEIREFEGRPRSRRSKRGRAA